MWKNLRYRIVREQEECGTAGRESFLTVRVKEEGHLNSQGAYGLTQCLGRTEQEQTRKIQSAQLHFTLQGLSL